MDARDLSQYKDVALPVQKVNYKDKTDDRLVFMIEIPIPGKTIFIFRLGSWFSALYFHYYWCS